MSKAFYSIAVRKPLHLFFSLFFQLWYFNKFFLNCHSGEDIKEWKYFNSLPILVEYIRSKQEISLLGWTM